MCIYLYCFRLRHLLHVIQELSAGWPALQSLVCFSLKFHSWGRKWALNTSKCNNNKCIGCPQRIYFLQHRVPTAASIQPGAEASSWQLHLHGYGRCHVLCPRVWGQDGTETSAFLDKILHPNPAIGSIVMAGILCTPRSNLWADGSPHHNPADAHKYW